MLLSKPSFAFASLALPLLVLGLRGMKKIFELGQINIFLFFLFMNPLYELILVFPRFDPFTAPGMTFCVNLGPKCHNLFPLVSD